MRLIFIKEREMYFQIIIFTGLLGKQQFSFP